MSDLVERLKINGEAWSNEASRDYEVQHFITLAKVQSRLQHEAAARITELEAALARARAWHESEDKALSKSGRSDREYHWQRCQHREQIDCFKTVQPDDQYNAAWDAMNARAPLAGQGDSHE